MKSMSAGMCVCAVIATLTGVLASNFASPPQNIVNNALPESRLVKAEPQGGNDLQRIQRWIQQLTDNQSTAIVMQDIQSLDWGSGLTNTQEANAAVVALMQGALSRMTGPIAAKFMTQVDRSAISLDTKVFVGRTFVLKYDCSFTSMLYECMLHLDKAACDDFYEILDKVTSWREFKIALAEALLVAGDSRTLPILLAQRERLVADAPSPTDYASRDQWQGMCQTLSSFIEYASAQQAQASLLALIQDESRLGKYPGTPDSIWAMRRLLHMGVPVADLRATLLDRVNQLWTDGVALTSGTDPQQRQRGGRMRTKASDWKAAGIKVGVLTASDAPMVPAPVSHASCR